jgi:hypothetical protein
MQKVARERSSDSIVVDREAHRRVTSRRLAAALGAGALTFAAAAAVAGTQGVNLIR